MQNNEQLPYINPPLDPPPQPGVRFQDKNNFVYEILEAKPHKNKDGTDSFLIAIRGQCAECGSYFISHQGPKRPNLPRRCPVHAAGKGREKTYPFGQIPVGVRGPAPAGVSFDQERVVREIKARINKAGLERARALEDPVQRRIVRDCIFDILHILNRYLPDENEGYVAPVTESEPSADDLMS